MEKNSQKNNELTNVLIKLQHAYILYLCRYVRKDECAFV